MTSSPNPSNYGGSVTLTATDGGPTSDAPATADTALPDAFGTDSEALQVDAALTQLARVEPRLAQVVEMRYFGGMSDSEVAAALGITDRTVRRDWDKARALLRTML